MEVTGNGWQELAYYFSPTPLHVALVSFTVPAKPALNENQAIAFFPAFQSADHTEILQPLLTYNSQNHAWYASSMFVNENDPGHAVIASGAVPVEVGQHISAYLLASPAGAYCGWEGLHGTELAIPNALPMWEFDIALEQTGTNQAGLFSGPLVADGIALISQDQAVVPAFQPIVNFNNAGVQIVGATEVILQTGQ